LAQQNTVQLNSSKSLSSSITFGSPAYKQLDLLIGQIKPTKIFLLTDSNTRACCVEIFLEQWSSDVKPIELCIPSGEQSKSIAQCNHLWQQLSDFGADRQSLLINLGGGVITDIGGFVAGTFMRGIRFVNIPTSLLAMVDAAIGGKTGVDFGLLKNQIGMMHFPEMILIDDQYLDSLPPEEIISGWAEVIKHGLIGDQSYWEHCSTLDPRNVSDWGPIIKNSVQIKLKVVEADAFEANRRKILNFGHTFGHAIESFRLEHTSSALSHGESIGVGMVLAAYFSTQLTDLDWSVAQQIRQVVVTNYGIESFDTDAQQKIEQLLIFDKKNSNGLTKFVLLKSPGTAVIDINVPQSLYAKGFDFYHTGV